MKLVNIESISTLEEYLLHMAMFSISLNGLAKLQQIAHNKGIFNDDEIENARTIQYEIDRLFTVLNDQVHLVSSRTPIEWTDVLRSVKSLLPIEKQLPKD